MRAWYWFECSRTCATRVDFTAATSLPGKPIFMKMFREQAQALGDDFVIRDFVDAFLSSGTIPMSLIRWEMTGNSDDVMRGNTQSLW